MIRIPPNLESKWAGSRIRIESVADGISFAMPQKMLRPSSIGSTERIVRNPCLYARSGSRVLSDGLELQVLKAAGIDLVALLMTED